MSGLVLDNRAYRALGSSPGASIDRPRPEGLTRPVKPQTLARRHSSPMPDTAIHIMLGLLQDRR